MSGGLSLMSNKYCWWSIGDGIHGQMLRSVVKSMQDQNIEGDIHLWTDQDEIPGATVHKIETNSFDKKHYLFKFNFLKEQVAKLDYEYFIFIDADSYFVKPLPYSPLDMMHGSPVHSFLESSTSNVENIRYDWWSCWIPHYEELMRDCGVNSTNVYNVNAGYWIVKKEAVKTFCELTSFFWGFAKSRGYEFTEEAPLAYATHMMCGDAEKHTLTKYPDMWASDWTGHFDNKLPVDEEWDFIDYFSMKPIKVRPSLVHCMRSKNVLSSMNQ
jgi:hypothetical protein